MTDHFTAFQGSHRLATGPLAEVALAVKKAADRAAAAILIFDDATGRPIDLDLRGSDADIVARLPQPADATQPPNPAAPRGRGRPKLGVVAREVTLLPRHWDWLASQPGGASVALRKLVHAAQQASALADRRRASQEAAYRFMVAVAGNRPGFEEATRALFAADAARFTAHTARWPRDVREHARRLAANAM